MASLVSLSLSPLVADSLALLPPPVVAALDAHVMRFCWHDWGKWEWMVYTEREYGYKTNLESRDYQLKYCKKCQKCKRRVV